MAGTEAHHKLLAGLQQTCSGSTDPNDKDNHVEVSFNVDEKGKVLDPKITYYAKNQQRTAEVLEAVSCLGPLGIEGPDKGKVLNEWSGIEPDIRNPAFNGSEVRKFRKSHALDENSFVIIHKIPLGLLMSHKGLFSARELRALNNLIAIPVGKDLPPIGNDPLRQITPSYVPTIASFYQQWSSVLGEPNLTKKMVLDEAKRLTTKLIAQGGEDFSSPP